jgi:hypothetical protein
MIGRVPSPPLFDLQPRLWLAGPARPLIGLQERRAPRAAAGGRRAAPNPSPAPARLGRPRCPRRAHRAPAARTAAAPASHPRHRAAVAPPPDHPQMDLPEPDRPAAGQRRDRNAHRAARHRERLVGVPADPGRAAQARSPGRRVHHPPGPEGAAGPAGAETAHRHGLAAVPARASRDDAGRRLLSRGLRGDPPASVLPGRDRSRQPLRPHPRGHRAPGRAAGHPADPQSPDGPRRSRPRTSGSRAATGPGSSPHRSTRPWPAPGSKP